MSSATNTPAYAKYLTRQPTPPPAEVLEKLTNGPMDPSLGLDPSNINSLFEPGYVPGEIGWCHRDNHTACLSILTKMPGVTLEMFKWWFAWHPLHDMRYQIWFPPCHYGASVSEEKQKLLADPAVPVEEKIKNVTHFVREDIYGRGGDVPTFNIHFRDPVDMGFDPEKVKDPNVAIVCAFPTPGVDVPNSGFMSSLVHFARKTEDGIEVRSRFFQGYTFIDKKPVIMTSAEHPVPEKAPAMLSRHCAEEFTNLSTLLPLIYAEEKDNWL